MRALRVSVLGQLIDRLRDTPEEALEYARQLLSLDPLSEAAHVQLIHLLGAMGKTREAIAQYDRCKRVLAAELGAQPSAELQLAHEPIGPRAVETILPANPTRPRIQRPIASKRALVGHEAGCGSGPPSRRRRCGSRERSDRGRSGIGRTRLLGSSPAWPSGRRPVLSGRAFEAETVRPYGPDRRAPVDACRT
jgi:hypothetical protein